LLKSISDTKKVTRAYGEVVQSLDWAGPNTSLKNSELQQIFITKDRPDNPYLQFQFLEDLGKDKELQEMRGSLKSWITKTDGGKTKAKIAAEKLKTFGDSFREGVDKLYSSW
jgi:hypothetical protein